MTYSRILFEKCHSCRNRISPRTSAIIMRETPTPIETRKREPPTYFSRDLTTSPSTFQISQLAIRHELNKAELKITSSL
ncbi:hypothetical protein Nhal_0387 [Nitrosococcus halophilus Nc 4]|uniref:Uncharacterized protein n=1 Tax=Nitrosococcus halophilus (strain Nc4) TaxID=472759 RepID=D5BVF1_NITHN|nr:hypothetical protein Nhal_0387 [Nitrosococcus halophilus Nc 4]